MCDRLARLDDHTHDRVLQLVALRAQRADGRLGHISRRIKQAEGEEPARALHGNELRCRRRAGLHTPRHEEPLLAALLADAFVLPFLLLAEVDATQAARVHHWGLLVQRLGRVDMPEPHIVESRVAQPFERQHYLHPMRQLALPAGPRALDMPVRGQHRGKVGMLGARLTHSIAKRHDALPEILARLAGQRGLIRATEAPPSGQRSDEHRPAARVEDAGVRLLGDPHIRESHRGEWRQRVLPRRVARQVVVANQQDDLDASLGQPADAVREREVVVGGGVGVRFVERVATE